MILQRLFSKAIRDYNALRIAKERLKGMRQKQREFLKKNLEKSVVSKNPEKVVNDVEAFKKRVGRTEINKVSDSEYAKKIEEVFG
jgi:hypothetical protein